LITSKGVGNTREFYELRLNNTSCSRLEKRVEKVTISAALLLEAACPGCDSRL